MHRPCVSNPTVRSPNKTRPLAGFFYWHIPTEFTCNSTCISPEAEYWIIITLVLFFSGGIYGEQTVYSLAIF